MGRPLSLIIVVFYLIIVGLWLDLSFAFRLGLILILPLAAIWFSEPLSRYVSPRITSRSPASLVRLAGWVLLLLAPSFMWLFSYLARPQ